MQQYYSDDEIRAMLLKEKKRKRRRNRVIKRCTVLLLLLIFIIFCMVSLVKCIAGSKDKDKKAEPVDRGLGLIFLDPGHGGMDGGTDANDRLEKNDNLKLALQVRKELKALGYTVKMSRTKDKDVDRDQRGVMANDAEADLFISLHRNQASEGNGVEVWIPAANDDASRTLGTKIMNALEEQGFSARGVHPGSLHDENEDYYENSIPTMPSCLVEVGFTNDAGDNKLFDKNLEANAKAIAKAIAASHKAIYEKEE